MKYILEASAQFALSKEEEEEEEEEEHDTERRSMDRNSRTNIRIFITFIICKSITKITRVSKEFFWYVI